MCVCPGLEGIDLSWRCWLWLSLLLLLLKGFEQFTFGFLLDARQTNHPSLCSISFPLSTEVNHYIYFVSVSFCFLSAAHQGSLLFRLVVFHLCRSCVQNICSCLCKGRPNCIDVQKLQLTWMSCILWHSHRNASWVQFAGVYIRLKVNVKDAHNLFFFVVVKHAKCNLCH